jgi:SAM-dependent methyltransferase
MNGKDILATSISLLINKPKRKTARFAWKVRNKTGLEVGGPSSFFKAKSYLPIYLLAKSVDGVNFSMDTVWEGKLKPGKTFNYYDNKVGYQYIDEAAELTSIPSDKYDFLLSCHSLEHIANPLKALQQWHRVLKDKGQLFLILPDKRFTFDHCRPYTTFEHIENDYRNNVGEDDTTHFDEMFLLHDIEKDAGLSDRAEMIERTNKNIENRCVHHHVFSLELLKQMLEFCRFNVSFQQAVGNFHLLTVAEKKI